MIESLPFAILTVALTGVPTPETLASEALASEALDARLRPAVEKFLEENSVPSACVGVVLDGEVSYTAAFGQRHRANGEMATTETLYGIGSVSKVFTATLAVLMEEEGDLSLDDLVADWWPSDSPMPGAGEITLRHLLSHTSGLPRSSPTRRNLAIDGPLNPGIALPMSREALREGLRMAELQNSTGETWDYSNFGVNIAGHVLECVSEQDFESLLRKRLLQPLGMDSTVIHRSDEDERRYAAHYWVIDPERKERPPWVFGEVAAAGGISCTIGDLTRFVAYHCGSGDSLPTTVRERMREPIIAANIGPDGMQCIGWFRYRLASPNGPRTVYTHGGEIDGHSAEILCDPEHGLGLAVMVNLGGSTAPDLGKALLPQLIR